MRVTIPTLVGLALLFAAPARAAVVLSSAYPNRNWHETPAQNVWRSQQYDYLLRWIAPQLHRLVPMTR
jgi:hypothetical protein